MLADIIAKTLVLVDQFLSMFATSEMITPEANETTCAIPYMIAGNTACGIELTDTLGELVIGLVRMAADALAGLAAVSA